MWLNVHARSMWYRVVSNSERETGSSLKQDRENGECNSVHTACFMRLGRATSRSTETTQHCTHTHTHTHTAAWPLMQAGQHSAASAAALVAMRC